MSGLQGDSSVCDSPNSSDQPCTVGERSDCSNVLVPDLERPPRSFSNYSSDLMQHNASPSTSRKRKSPADDSASESQILRSRKESAKECRTRKKLRYQYLEELVNTSEAMVRQLKEELRQVRISTFSTTDWHVT